MSNKPLTDTFSPASPVFLLSVALKRSIEHETALMASRNVQPAALGPSTVALE